MKTAPLVVIDVAHPPRAPALVEDQLMDALRQMRFSAGRRVMKIIHGHGSSGRGGSTKNVVQNWLYVHRSKFREIIPGEDYSLFSEGTQALRKEVGEYVDPDLENANPGITIVWIK